MMDTIIGQGLDGVVVEPGEAKDLGDIVVDENKSNLGKLKSATEKPKAAPATDEPSVAGRVTLPGGQPAVGTHVAVIAFRNRTHRGGDLSPSSAVLAKGQTDGNGGFRLSWPAASSKTHRFANLIAGQDSYAIAWQQLDLSAKSKEASLALASDKPIRGRLVDIEGLPASGVQLSIRSLSKKSLDGVSLQPNGVGYHGETIPAAWLQAVESDEQGRFTLRGVPEGYGAWLDVAGSDRFAPQSIALNTGIAEQRGERDGTYRPLVKNLAAGEEALLPLAPAQLFEGRVTYEDTGAPAAGARLTIWASQQQFGSMTSVAGRADEQGKYRISPNPGIRFGINAYAPDGTPYLARRTPSSETIEWQAGVRVKQVDIKLPRGVLVRGTVLDAATKTPVAGASVQYHPESVNNPNEKDEILTGWQGISLSDEHGKFEIAVLPGPGRLLIHGPGDKYVLRETTEQEINRGKPGGRRNYAHAIERIEPAPGAEPTELTIELEPGATINGRLVDEQGKPIDEALVISRLFILPHSPFWRGYGGEVPPPTLGGKFELSGLGAGQQYNVCFLDAKHRLGATETIRADSKDPTVVLRPCGQASARFVDSEGRPHVGFSPALHIVVTPGEHERDLAAAKLGRPAADADFVSNVDRTNYPSWVETDDQGRVTFPALIPGATYRLDTYQDGKPVILKQFSVKPGEQVELGDVAIELKR